jgi:putative Mn2+ efflux pump MntP
MIYEAFYRNPEGKMGSLNYSVLLMLAVATSIDAFFVGIRSSKWVPLQQIQKNM